MKTSTLYLFLTGCIFILGLYSCENDAKGVLYEGDRNMVTFASTQMNSEVTAEDNGTVKIPIYRGEKKGELNITLSLSSESNLFSLKSTSATFKDGEATCYAELDFGDINNLSPTDSYECSISISEKEKISIAGIGLIKITMQRKLTWESYGVGEYVSELFGESWKQPIEKAKEGNIYRLPDCITKGFPLIFVLSDDGQTLTSWPPQPTGYKHNTYGMIYFSPSSMVKDGNSLKFAMRGLVIYNGKFAVLYKGFTETLTLP